MPLLLATRKYPALRKNVKTPSLFDVDKAGDLSKLTPSNLHSGSVSFLARCPSASLNLHSGSRSLVEDLREDPDSPALSSHLRGRGSGGPTTG